MTTFTRLLTVWPSRARVAGALFGFVSLLSPAVASAADIARYAVLVEADLTGRGHATATLDMLDVAGGVLEIPVGFDAVTRVQVVAAPPGTQATFAASPPLSTLTVTLPAGRWSVLSVSVAFDLESVFVLPTPAGERPTLPTGTRMFRHVLLQSRPGTIGDYVVELALPSGLRGHAVRDSAPKLRKTESTPRVQFDAVEGREGARLRVHALAQGETAVMQVELSPREWPVGFIGVGLLLSLGYLVAFRDLVRRTDALHEAQDAAPPSTRTTS